MHVAVVHVCKVCSMGCLRAWGGGLLSSVNICLCAYRTCKDKDITGVLLCGTICTELAESMCEHKTHNN